MNKNEKWEFINNLDDELLLGGVILSEWSAFLVRDTDTAFANGAHLAALITSLAAIESHLKYEYGSKKRERLVNLIDSALIKEDLRAELHSLRQYRNRWVHVSDPHEDGDLIRNIEAHEVELERMAERALRALRRTIYAEQWL